jgi:large subunit ribosomal protein L25
MADITLNAELRTELGSPAAGRLRAAGKLPAVIYGKGITPISIVLDHHETSVALNTTAKRAETFTLVLDGTSHTVKIQEIQRDPVRRNARHLDLMIV